ncbi:uncharacterized protein LOC120331268 [Styela clava]|uniref:cell number regulator 2-like n=1 Tax=Styela clava TaxID=7725 RepID=UPI00193A2304|nr:cell number regulator 2-like [Styela clava]
MGEFQHGLCGCFDNCGVCIITYFIPCYTMGKTAEAVGEDCCICALAYMFTGCIAGGIVRGKVRAMRGIEGSGIGDFCVHCWCPLCAVIQDHLEVVPSGMGEDMSRA